MPRNKPDCVVLSRGSNYFFVIIHIDSTLQDSKDPKALSNHSRCMSMEESEDDDLKQYKGATPTTPASYGKVVKKDAFEPETLTPELFEAACNGTYASASQNITCDYVPKHA